MKTLFKIFFILGWGIAILNGTTSWVNSKLLSAERNKVNQMVDTSQIRLFSFYYTDHNGKPAVHERIYMLSKENAKVEEGLLCSNVTGDLKSSNAYPYWDNLDSLSIAHLEKGVWGYLNKEKITMTQFRWHGKLAWKK